jgi:hypothetical protein
MSDEDLLNPTLDLPPDPMDFVVGMEDDALELVSPEDTSEAEEAPAEEVVAETAPETESEPEPEPEPKPEPLPVDRFAEIARMEAQLLVQKQQLEQEQAKLADARSIQEMIARGDNLDALAKMGVTYDQLTKDYIQGKGPSTEDSIRQELEAKTAELRAEIEKLREPQRQRFEAEERQRVAEALAEDDNFPLLQAVNGADRIFDRVKSHYQQTGEIQSYVDAAQAVETELRAVVSALKGHPRAAELLGLPGNSAPVETPKTESREDEGAEPVTLSNELAATKTVVVEDEFDPTTASDDELIDRLANQLRFV